ncbi:MAG: acyltransferase family protein [Pseudomonadota bacterium]
MQGLRAIAVLAVVVYHLSPAWIPGGFVGVDVFFVISGYLITGLIKRSLDEGTFSMGEFLARRARRLFPALFVMVAATLGLGYFLLLPSDYAHTLRAALGAITSTSNVYFWRLLAEGYFAPDAKLNPLLHTWSLGIEVQFYLLFPLLLLYLKNKSLHQTQSVVLALALISLAASACLLAAKPVAVFFLAPFRAWELLAGALVALRFFPEISSIALKQAFSATGLAAVFGACFLYDGTTAFPGLTALLPALGTLALLQTRDTAVHRALESRPLVFIGLISYSLYLWHWPLWVYTQFATGFVSSQPFFPLLLVAAMGLAVASFHLVEQPCRAYLVPRHRKLFVACLGMCATIFMAGGAFNGYAGRFDAQTRLLDAARTESLPLIAPCLDKATDQLCRLGSNSMPPRILLWGDSHAATWAPALDQSLTSFQKSALFSWNSLCPPLFPPDGSVLTGCDRSNLAVKKMLENEPQIDTVVLSAYWAAYFGGLAHVPARTWPRETGRASGGAEVLSDTLEWLQKRGTKIIILGPLPTYEQSVPLGIAMEQVMGKQFPIRQKFETQRLASKDFFNVMERFSGAPFLHFIEPDKWLCRPICDLAIDGRSLYRDNNHLSHDGALPLEPQLRIHLRNALLRDESKTPPSQPGLAPSAMVWRVSLAIQTPSRSISFRRDPLPLAVSHVLHPAAEKVSSWHT